MSVKSILFIKFESDKSDKSDKLMFQCFLKTISKQSSSPYQVLFTATR